MKILQELKAGDKVKSRGGVEIVKDTIPVFKSPRYVQLKIPSGRIKCTPDHLFPCSDYFGKETLLSALQICSAVNLNTTIYLFSSTGRKRILSASVVEKPLLVACIKTPSEEFYINVGGTHILTHNCQFRVAAGRLTSIPSMMLFNNMAATRIPTQPKGRGLVSSNGELSQIQYYFTEFSWIEDFYKKAGLNDHGYRISGKINNEDKRESDNRPSDVSINDIFSSTRKEETFEVSGIQGSLNKSREQNFE